MGSVPGVRRVGDQTDFRKVLNRLIMVLADADIELWCQGARTLQRAFQMHIKSGKEDIRTWDINLQQMLEA